MKENRRTFVERNSQILFNQNIFMRKVGIIIIIVIVLIKIQGRVVPFAAVQVPIK